MASVAFVERRQSAYHPPLVVEILCDLSSRVQIYIRFTFDPHSLNRAG